MSLCGIIDRTGSLRHTKKIDRPRLASAGLRFDRMITQHLLFFIRAFMLARSTCAIRIWCGSHGVGLETVARY
jgi:hypothetical protein